jgi:hypothetical protein
MDALQKEICRIANREMKRRKQLRNSGLIGQYGRKNKFKSTIRRNNHE